MNEPKEERNYKGFIIGSIVTFVVTGIIMGIILLISFTQLTEVSVQAAYVGWIDALGLSGAIMLLFYLLNLLSREGAFDILAYSLKLVWFNTFYRSIKDTKLPRTYREYRELKRGTRKDRLLFLLVGPLPYILAAIIVMIIYYTHII